MRKKLHTLFAAGNTWCANCVLALCAPALCIFTMEWLHRGTLEGLWTIVTTKPDSFILSYLLVLCLYLLVVVSTKRAWAATLLTGVVLNAAGVVCFYKLQMRGEPFLPWDFSQIRDLLDVSGEVSFQFHAFMLWPLVIFLLLFAISWFVRLPVTGKAFLKARIGTALGAALLGSGIFFGVFLQPQIAERFSIIADMWMQDRYYRTYGVITGFCTNLSALDIAEPADYSQENVQAVAEEMREAAKTAKPLFAGSYAAQTDKPEAQPNIIFVMNESFWDVTRLEGISYDRALTPNLTALRDEAATGYIFSPSFGGGTCDVEFEALTGYAIEHLPSGCKPFQQHVTRDMASLPQHLKANGYETLAIHGYYERFWSRDTAYPNLGIDTFIALEDFVNPEKRRGFVSDAEMTRRIIQEYESREENAPLFIHAVTMQNHTTYSEKRYREDELVELTETPAGMSAETKSQLRDFATGVYEADAALGTLIAYFRAVEEPTIIVFWGDHFNPLGTGYQLYELTNYIEKGDITSPNLRTPDLLIWSNYTSQPVDLGVLSTYQLSPVIMDLFGLEKPLYFEFLAQQFPMMRGRTHGITVNPDSSFSEEMTDAQQTSFDAQWLLQYDLMFGNEYLLETE